MAPHFVDVATCPNLHIAMFAVDSLGQLASKFLEKDELTHFHFQVEFLRPFEVVMTTPGVSAELKELIVSILANMVQGRAANIKSGWKIVLGTLYAAVSCPEPCPEPRLKTAYSFVQRELHRRRALPRRLHRVQDGPRREHLRPAAP